VGAGVEPASHEESFTAWRRCLESWAEARETILVFEDLHWADEALLSFLEHLADWSEVVPLLLLCTARPELHEQQPAWAAGLRNATTINLAPLTDEETARLISSLLERAVLPAETQRALLERAGGNPLYAEEFVRLLADRGELRGAVEEMPDSVQALIAARLDTLSAERKSLLQDAAVVGKVFWAGALAEMGNREPREVELALHELARKELVRPVRTSSMQGEAEYGFWHLLVRDVCYAQIPRAARATRHRAAAAWLERKAGERAEDLADVLAHHYLQALELARAAGQAAETEELEASTIRYLALAGERALSLDVERAEQSLARALELAPADHPERRPCSSAGRKPPSSRTSCRRHGTRSRRRSPSTVSRARAWPPGGC
jgi:predicted ATPase